MFISFCVWEIYWLFLSLTHIYRHRYILTRIHPMLHICERELCAPGDDHPIMYMCKRRWRGIVVITGCVCTMMLFWRWVKSLFSELNVRFDLQGFVWRSIRSQWHVFVSFQDPHNKANWSFWELLWLLPIFRITKRMKNEYAKHHTFELRRRFLKWTDIRTKQYHSLIGNRSDRTLRDDFLWIESLSVFPRSLDPKTPV